MKKKSFFPLLLLILVGFIKNSYATNTVRISERSCRFSITIPLGWDSIPSRALKVKRGKMPVSLALYSKGQSSYFTGNYVIISVLPTIKPLSTYKFKDIVKEVEQMSKKVPQKQSDTLKVEYGEAKSYVVDGHFHVCTGMKILKDSVEVTCVQDLLLTKFGYISISCYAKGDNAQTQSRNITQLISKSIKVEPDYQYTEPEKPSVFTLRNIGISVGIGLLVFLIITILGKKKK